MNPPSGGWPDPVDVALLVPLFASLAAALVLALAEWRASRPAWVRPLLFLCPLLVLGGALRIGGIDRRSPWEDEGLTAVRASGFRMSQVVAVLNRGASLSELRQFARPAPGTLGWFLLHPGRHNPDVHPPLYFVLARLWLELWGGGVHAIRLLSALLGLFAIPAAGWLALEATGRPRAALLAAAALAVSPLQVVYGQEARMYSLLVVLTLASSAALLRFLRLGGARRARLYAALVGLGSLTHGLFPLAVAGHAAFLAVRRRDIAAARARQAFFACLAGLACGASWALVGYFRDRQRRLDWLVTTPDLASWGRRVVAGFAMNVGAFELAPLLAPFLAVALLLVLAEAGRRRASQGLAIAVPAALWIVTLVVLDWQRGSTMAAHPRYLIAPGALCLVLAAIALDSAMTRWRRGGALAAAALLLVVAAQALSASRATKLWFKPSGLTAELAAALRDPSPAHLFVLEKADASPDLVALAEVATAPVWVKAGDPEGPAALVWSRAASIGRLAARLDGSFVPMTGRIYRFEPAPVAVQEDR